MERGRFPRSRLVGLRAAVGALETFLGSWKVESPPTAHLVAATNERLHHEQE